MRTTLRRLTGRPPDGLTAECDQCGRLGVDVLRMTSRRIRCSCRACGAVFTSDDPSRVRPIEQAWLPAPAPAGADALTTLLPERMVAWLRVNVDAADLVDEPDRAALYDWYARYDDFVRRARTSAKARALYDQTSDVALEQVPVKLPSIGHVVDALHRSCYDQERALASVLERGPQDDDPHYRVHVRERVSSAARWLSSAGGRPYRWIDESVQPEPGSPDPAAVRALLEPGALEGPRDWERNRLLTGALFGTARGPSPSSLIAQFSPERIEQALRAYVEDGTRPLRDEVLAFVRAAAP